MAISAAHADGPTPQPCNMTLNATSSDGYTIVVGCKNNEQTASIEFDVTIPDHRPIAPQHKEFEMVSLTISTESYPADAEALTKKIIEIGMSGLSKSDKKELKELRSFVNAAYEQSDPALEKSDMTQVTNELEEYLRSAR